MAASQSLLSSDSSNEVWITALTVILFVNIPTVISFYLPVVALETSTIAPVISSAAPVVETTLVASPTGLCGLVPYSGFYSDSPDEMSSPEHISPLPAISPFLCTDSFEAPDSFDGPLSQDPYVATVARWRSRVTTRSSSTSKFPIALVTAPPGIRRRSAILIRPGEAIPFGRPYRTYLNGPCNLLTARKRVGPLPAHRLACRHASPCSSDHRSSSSSSSSDSLLVHSSGLDASDQAHSRSSTRDVPPRLYSPERPLHSSSHSAGPSRKRCRSPVDYVPSSTPVMGSLAPTRADLLPPRKRFRDSYSSEASIEEDTEIDPIETEVDMELGIGNGDDVRDHVEIDPRDVSDDTEEYEADTSAGDTVEVGIDPMSAPIVEEEIVEPAREDSSDLSGTRDGIVRSFEDMPIDLDDVVRDFYHHMSEVRIDRIVGIETAQRRLEADQLIARGQRVSMIERIDSLRLENLKVRAMLDIERDRVNSLRLHMSLSQEELRQNNDYHSPSCYDHEAIEETLTDDVEEAFGLLMRWTTCQANALETENQSQNGIDGDNGNGGNRNGRNGNGRNKNPDENVRGDRPVARECTYQDFMKCQPLNFKGTEGVVGLIRWFEKMETLFHISNCTEKTEAAFAMSWRELIKLMTEVYNPRNKIQKMETELWNLTVKNNDLTAYTQRFQVLTKMCTKMVLEEEDRVEKFIGGLPDNIQGNVIAAEPTRLQDAVRIANNLMDQKLKGYINVARAYMAGNNEKNGYEGTRPFCNKCKLHHEGQCTIKCNNCKKVGHMTRDCRAVIATSTQGTQGRFRGLLCFECGAQGHYRKDCPKVKNQNHGNKARIPDARGKAYVLGGGDVNPGSNTVTGTFLLNDHHAYMIFDSGADKSFVSNTFSAFLDIIPSALDVSYAVELANGRTSETNTVPRGCTLGLIGHPFNIDLMPIDLGSFDVIIGMDWLAQNHAVVVYDEKIVRIPYGNEILIVQGDKSDKEKKSTLSIISCVTVERKQRQSKEEAVLEDVPTVQDFPEVFPEDLPGLPPIRQVEFQINLVPGAAPVARAPYRLAPSKMEESSTQL
ncbi:putative reverse transcriptase domain-containing protein [Tanacetum coccineum]|uniref:Reverse transcriptase domain-containing protein n=1 Tax=Tanacetum coccineum TaxID=301880 RepID=A0ABQ5F5D5_9ASTR